jgi:hypothetical protein
MYKFILIIVSLVLISCSTSTSESDIQKSQISDILIHIEEGFNEFNADKIISYFHTDFLFDGKNLTNIYYDWQDRMTLYSMIKIEILDIELQDDYATAYLKIYFYDTNNRYGPFLTPEMYGDLAYFFYDKGQWQLFGNQSPDKQ